MEISFNPKKSIRSGEEILKGAFSASDCRTGRERDTKGWEEVSRLSSKVFGNELSAT